MSLDGHGNPNPQQYTAPTAGDALRPGVVQPGQPARWLDPRLQAAGQSISGWAGTHARHVYGGAPAVGERMVDLLAAGGVVALAASLTDKQHRVTAAVLTAPLGLGIAFWRGDGGAPVGVRPLCPSAYPLANAGRGLAGLTGGGFLLWGFGKAFEGVAGLVSRWSR